MNNVDKAMELAEQLAADAEDWKAYVQTEQSLRTHLEAMEADRVRLLEALIWYVKNDDTELTEDNKYWLEGLNKARAAIAQSEAQS